MKLKRLQWDITVCKTKVKEEIERLQCKNERLEKTLVENGKELKESTLLANDLSRHKEKRESRVTKCQLLC